MHPPHVRRAGAGDALALAELQVRAQHDVGDRLLPAGALEGLSAQAVLPSWEQLLAAGQELVLVAVDEHAAVRGCAVLGAATDDDLAADCHELGLLLIDPQQRAAGHGSRLLAAVADHARAAGAGSLTTWVLAGDGDLVRFLRGAGWAPDASRRELDAGAPVTEIRLRSSLE